MRAIADADPCGADRAPGGEETGLLLAGGELLVARAASIPPQEVHASVRTLDVDSACSLVRDASGDRGALCDLGERARGAVVPVHRRRDGVAQVRQPAV